MESYTRAVDLPPEWDTLCADNYAATRAFLSAMEKGNPCEQRYHVFRSSCGTIDSLAITFVAPSLNLLCFTPFAWRVRATLVHVPASVARPGMVLGTETRGAVEAFIRSIPGYVVVMNSPPDLRLPSCARGRTCFSVSIPLRWQSFDEYLADLRSHYRYRFRRALKKGAALRFALLEDNAAFDPELFRLYENVHDRSRIGVERLTIHAFRLRSAKILVARAGERPVGFVQMIENGTELVFAFVGLDYQQNGTYDVYQNLLLRMMAYAIDHGFERIELGQTAESAKLRLGGQYQALYLHLRHSNPLLNALAHLAIPLIQYRPPAETHTVFRNGGAPR